MHATEAFGSFLLHAIAFHCCQNVVTASTCRSGVWIETTDMMNWHISRGHGKCTNTERFPGSLALLPLLAPTEWSIGRDTWGIFGQPLQRAMWNTRGLHAELSICGRDVSVWDSA